MNSELKILEFPQTRNSNNELKPYLFEVEERKVHYETIPPHLFPIHQLTGTESYKAIVRKDNERLISIMPQTYNVVSNREVILPVLDFLTEYDNKWLIDQSHSFVDDGRMRLQITFPDLTVNDGTSEIALSLFLHNSYTGVEGVRGFWGGIRGICSNGMVFGELLGKFYHRHTNGINLDLLKEQVMISTEKLPVIQQRINILQSINTNSQQLEAIENKLGKKIKEYVDENYDYTDNQWKLLNVLTYYISHNIQKHLRSRYQLQVSKLFNI